MADSDGGEVSYSVPITSYVGTFIDAMKSEDNELRDACERFKHDVIVPWSAHGHKISGRWERGGYIFEAESEKDIKVYRIEEYSHNIR